MNSFQVLVCAVLMQQSAGAAILQSWGWVVDKGNKSEYYSSYNPKADASSTLLDGEQIGADNGSLLSGSEHVYVNSWAQASLTGLKTFAAFELEKMQPGSYTTPTTLALATAYAFFNMQINSPKNGFVYFLPTYRLHGSVNTGSAFSGTVAYSCVVWGTQVSAAPFNCRGNDGASYRYINEYITATPHTLTRVPLNTPFLWYTASQTGATLGTEDTGLTVDGFYYGQAEANFSSTVTLESVLVLDESLQPLLNFSLFSSDGLIIPIDPANSVPEPGTFGAALAGALMLAGWTCRRQLQK
ncbi:hypothetical protein [Paludibaculum fermentans]|uniref:hypothetical protein n=1 Tax=Paludibaculum fermentans TaxID=1473598 RepID=UPI003EBD2D74